MFAHLHTSTKLDTNANGSMHHKTIHQRLVIKGLHQWLPMALSPRWVRVKQFVKTTKSPKIVFIIHVSTWDIEALNLVVKDDHVETFDSKVTSCLHDRTV